MVKFRAYHVHDKRWLEDFRVEKHGEFVFVGTLPYKVGVDVVLEESHLQKDTNGKLIFEGDIVEFQIDEYAVEQLPSIHRTGISKVYCDYGHFLFDVWGDGIVPYRFNFGNYPQTKVTVIGNIHDNPEKLNKNTPRGIWYNFTMTPVTGEKEMCPTWDDAKDGSVCPKCKGVLEEVIGGLQFAQGKSRMWFCWNCNIVFDRYPDHKTIKKTGA